MTRTHVREYAGSVRVKIEAPDGWGPTRVLIGQLRDLGYEVTEWRVPGRSVLEIL